MRIYKGFLVGIGVALGALTGPAAEAASFEADILSDAVDANPGDGVCDADVVTEGAQCTLRAAIQEANEAGEATRIRLGPGIHTLSIAGVGEDMAATGDLDIAPGSRISVRGRGEDSVIDADGIDRIFDVLAGAQLELRRLVLQNGAAPPPETGGGIRSTGSLAVNGCSLRSNSAVRGGGLHHAGDGTAELSRSELSGNTATGTAADDGGGGAYNAGATLEVSGSRFVGNAAAGPAEGDLAAGGGIFNDGGTLLVSRSDFEGNSAQSTGGGIASIAGLTVLERVDLRGNTAGPNPGAGAGFHQSGGGDATLNGGLFEDNRAETDGGALWNGAGLMTVRRARISGNAAGGGASDEGGGGIFNAGGDLTVEGTRIHSNEAESGAGGGILNDGGTLVVLKSRIEDNSARRSGGGIASRDGRTQLEKATLHGNAAGPNPGQGGGLHLADDADADGVVTVLRSRICGNTASTEGGGLWNSAAGEMSVSRSKVCDNTASGSLQDQGGGGLFNGGGMLSVVDRSRISRNTAATGAGGGILNDRGDVVASDVSIDRNEARRAGGGVAAIGGLAEETGTTALLGVKLSHNAASGPVGQGGGLHLTDDGRVDVEGSQIVYNEAVSQGGGLWNSATGTTLVSGTIFRRNQAPEEGGPDTFNDGGDLVIDGEPQP